MEEKIRITTHSNRFSASLGAAAWLHDTFSSQDAIIRFKINSGGWDFRNCNDASVYGPINLKDPNRVQWFRRNMDIEGILVGISFSSLRFSRPNWS